MKSYQVFGGFRGPVSPIDVSNAIIAITGDEHKIQGLVMGMSQTPPAASTRAPAAIKGIIGQ